MFVNDSVNCDPVFAQFTYDRAGDSFFGGFSEIKLGTKSVKNDERYLEPRDRLAFRQLSGAMAAHECNAEDRRRRMRIKQRQIQNEVDYRRIITDIETKRNSEARIKAAQERNKKKILEWYQSVDAIKDFPRELYGTASHLEEHFFEYIV